MKQELANFGTTKEKPRCVVKLRTTYWYSCNALNQQKSIVYLSKRSTVNFLSEECSATSAEDAFMFLEDINKLQDGIYELVYEGYKDYFGEWHMRGLRLVPYQE